MLSGVIMFFSKDSKLFFSAAFNASILSKYYDDTCCNYFNDFCTREQKWCPGFKLASVALIIQIQHISLTMKCMHGLSSTYDHNQTIPITSFTSNKTIGA